LKHDLQEVAFRPYGISMYGDKLMAINEGYEKGGESVLVFQIQPDWKLKLVNSHKFDDSKLGVFNDIHALSEYP
jgi:hypothetical protein